MITTLNKIRSHYPCESGWKNLLATLGKTKGDDEPLSIITILDSNGLDDALRCLRAVEGREQEVRLFAVWCAHQVQHLMTDQRSMYAIDMAERFANGLATKKELAAARAASYSAAVDADDAAYSAAGADVAARAYAARAAASAADYEAADAASDAADAYAYVARFAAESAQEQKLREICAEVESRQ